MKKNLAFLLLFPFAVYSQTLPELVQDAMENQMIASYKKNIESIKDEYKSVKKSYLPTLNLQSNYSVTDEETPSVAEKSFTASADVDFTIYDGGAKGAKYNSYENMIKSSDKNLESIKNNIALEVINHYFNYESLVYTKEAKEKEIETLNAQKDRLEKFFNSGTVTRDEVDKIVSRVESAKVALHQIELEIQTILHNLEYITAKKVTIEKGSKIEDIMSIQSEIKPDIEALEYDMKTILSTAREVKSSDYPTVSLKNSYKYYDNQFENKNYETDLETQNILGINLTWKLYDFGTTKAKQESFIKKHNSIKSKYEYEKNKADIDLKLSKKAFEIAKLKINLAQVALKAATSTYEIIEKKYQNGLVDNVSYLEALSEKYDAMSALKSAIYDLEIKKAQVVYHSGKNLKEFIK